MAHKVLYLLKSTFVLSIEIIISILLSILIIPVGLVITLLNELVRLIATGILHVQCRNSGSKITLCDDGTDNIWSYQKANNGRTCLSLLFCANPISIPQHRKLYMSRVINHTTKHGRKPYDKLRKILTVRCGYNCHKLDDSFDIQNHVRFWPGTDNPNVIVEESQFLNEILPALFKDMDESKPQWEEVIIPRFRKVDLTPTSSSKYGGPSPLTTVRILRYHHGFMDGASNLLLWTSCMTEDQGASFPYPVNPLMDSGRVSKCERLLYDLSCVILGAFTMVKSVINAGRLKSRFVTPKFTGDRHFRWSESVHVDTLRRIKAGSKSSVPAMLATALGGAFRKLNERYPNTQYGNPEEVVIGLVSALLPYANHYPRNQFTVVHFPVLTGSKGNKSGDSRELQKSSDNLQRLQITHRNMLKLGRDPIVYLNYFMFKYFGRFPASLGQAMMENGGLPVVVSNVPLSKEIVKFWDNPVVTAVGWPPLLTNTGLGIVTMRYADHMRFCAVADDACLSPEALDYLMKEAVTELRSLADECSDFETVIHKAENNGRGSNDGVMIMSSNNSTNGAFNSYVNPRNMSINTVTMDFRRGSFPTQIIDTTME